MRRIISVTLGGNIWLRGGTSRCTRRRGLYLASFAGRTRLAYMGRGAPGSKESSEGRAVASRGITVGPAWTTYGTCSGPGSIHRESEKGYSRKLGFRCRTFSDTRYLP